MDTLKIEDSLALLEEAEVQAIMERMKAHRHTIQSRCEGAARALATEIMAMREQQQTRPRGRSAEYLSGYDRLMRALEDRLPGYLSTIFQAIDAARLSKTLDGTDTVLMFEITPECTMHQLKQWPVDIGVKVELIGRELRVKTFGQPENPAQALLAATLANMLLIHDIPASGENIKRLSQLGNRIRTNETGLGLPPHTRFEASVLSTLHQNAHLSVSSPPLLLRTRQGVQTLATENLFAARTDIRASEKYGLRAWLEQAIGRNSSPNPN